MEQRTLAESLQQQVALVRRRIEAGDERQIGAENYPFRDRIRIFVLGENPVSEDIRVFTAGEQPARKGIENVLVAFQRQRTILDPQIVKQFLALASCFAHKRFQLFRRVGQKHLIVRKFEKYIRNAFHRIPHISTHPSNKNP